MTSIQNYQDRIIVDPDILVGKPVIKGTRIPVEIVLARLAEDLNLKNLFADYPRLTKEDIQAALAYARNHLATDQAQTTRQRSSDQRKTTVQEALALAGAWADIPSEQMEEDLDRIRHQSKPTPPIDLDL